LKTIRLQYLPTLIGILFACGCGGGGSSSDGSNNSGRSPIVGSWTPKSLQFNNDDPIYCPATVNQHGIERGCEANAIVTFYSDHTATGAHGERFTWSMSGDSLTVNDPAPVTVQITFTGNLATWVYHYPNSPDVLYSTYEKISP
jgi:hypothetical protein